MTLVIKKAERKKTKLKLAISAPSGGGKTYSALLLAKGLCGDWSKVCVIDTENESASLYTNLGDYNTIVLPPPFTPEKYVEAINTCVQAGMEAIIIDSMSHEWEAEGGALDLQSQMGGRYQDWAKVTPRHRAFVNAILQAPAHVIGTMRRKTDYEMTKEGNKTIVSKVGLKEVQREGMEYEFTIHFALDQNHNAKAEKDRTGLFDKKPEFLITEKTGEQLKAWANSGAQPASEAPKTTLQSVPPPENDPSDALRHAQIRKVRIDYLKQQGIPDVLHDLILAKMVGKGAADLMPVIAEVRKEAGI